MGFLDWLEKGDVQEVRKCLQQGADVNTRGFGHTPLIYAIRGWNREEYKQIVKLLLEYGADVNLSDWVGNTPLLATIFGGGGYEALKLLLEYGVDVESNGQAVTKYTPLMCAARNGKSKVVKLLLENGVDIEAKDFEGKTALKTATLWKRTETAKILKDEIKWRKQVKMARYTLLRHTNFHLALEISLRLN